MSLIQLQTLGGLRLSGPDGELLAGRRKELALLTYVARRAPQSVAREELVALLWGDRPEASARQSLRQALLYLKQATHELVLVEPEHVSLAPDRLELDVAAFEADVAADRLEQAVERWGGEFLAGAEDVGAEPYRLWLEQEREALRQRLWLAFDRLITQAAQRGATGETIEWAERWTRAMPLDERAHTALIDALARAERFEEALAHHAAFLARSRGELELEPSQSFLRLGQEIQERARRQPRRRPSPGSSALFTPDLMGRRGALDQFNAAWDAAQAGAVSVVLVEGEEGIGKTRLCEDFLRTVSQRSQPVVVLGARAREAMRDTPGGVVRELLAGLRDAPGLVGAPAGALAGLSSLVPGLRDRLRLAGSPTAWPADEALAQVLRDVTEDRPVILFLDDFPAADPATQQLLLAVAQRLSKARILILLTARSSGAIAPAAWTALQAIYGVRTLRLQPLDAAAVEGLLGSMLEVRDAERHPLALRLHADSGGNPFFVIQMVAALLDEGHLLPDPDGTWRLAPASPEAPLPAPATLREAVGRRLDQLSPAARRLADAAAVLAEPAEATLLAGVGGVQAPDLEPPLEELLVRRLLRVVPQRPVAYEFVHDVSRRVAYQLLPPARREALHRAALKELRARARQVEVPAAVLRYHRSRAGSRFSSVSRWWTLPRTAAALSGIALVGSLLWLRGRQPTEPTLLAVGAIRDHTGGDTSQTAAIVRDMLATNLARLPGLQVVSNPRMLELIGQLPGQSDPATALSRAARQAGAQVLIEAVLYRQPPAGLRLDLQRIDLRTGAVRWAHSVTGADPFGLVDSATAHIADAAGFSATGLNVADVTTTSLVAYRLYQEGLTAYFEKDLPSARRLFAAALAQDSTFAMAAFYAARVSPGLEAWQRAVRLADRATERERLLIRGHAASSFEDPARLAIAETLVTRFPADLDGHLLLGNGLLWGGQFLDAVPHLRHVVTMDSLALQSGQQPCRACAALGDLVDAYRFADSLGAAEQVARWWVERQPKSPTAWDALAAVLRTLERYDEALAAFRTAASLTPGGSYDPTSALPILLGQGRFEEANQALEEYIRDAPPATRGGGLWDRTIVLRYQGRLREALADALEARRLAKQVNPQVFTPQYEAIVHAQVLQDMGRYRQAAALWDSLARDVPRWATSRGGLARQVTWLLSHEATALASLGDTARLRRLADSLEILGPQSAFGRDRRLHHYVRGFIFRLEGRHLEAANAFRQALFGPYFFTRTNLELGRCLLAAGRTREAIPALRDGLRGPVIVWGLYATGTEFHELLGQAYEATGQPDSALIHYRWVLNAWRHADPELAGRRQAIESRVAALERPTAHP